MHWLGLPRIFAVQVSTQAASAKRRQRVVELSFLSRKERSQHSRSVLRRLAQQRARNAQGLAGGVCEYTARCSVHSMAGASCRSAQPVRRYRHRLGFVPVLT